MFLKFVLQCRDGGQKNIFNEDEMSTQDIQFKLVTVEKNFYG